MEIKPIGKRVLVEVTREIKTVSGIILSPKDEQKDEKPIKALVLAVGDQVTEVSAGDTVIINKYCGNTVGKNDDNTVYHRVININDVLAIIN